MSCVRGCVYRKRHVDDCDEPNCVGCLPRRAEYGRLCFSCHRRIETVLVDMPALAAWLGSHLATQNRRAARQDWERKGTQEHPPPPINLTIFDHLDVLQASLAGWVTILVDGSDLVGPDHSDITSTSGYLLTHLDSVEACDWIDAAWEELTLLVHEAHALAPWRPELRRVEAIPCPDCHSCALVIFGGEEDVTCLECRTVIPKERYLIWTRIAADQWGARA